MEGFAARACPIGRIADDVTQQRQEVWLWLALDAHTKLIVAAELGPRTQALAHALIHASVQTLAPGCIPVFTSDGLNLYFYSLTAHFGAWVEIAGTKKREWQVAASLLYGQLIKSYRRRKLTRVEWVMRWGTLEALQTKVQDLARLCPFAKHEIAVFS